MGLYPEKPMQLNGSLAFAWNERSTSAAQDYAGQISHRAWPHSDPKNKRPRQHLCPIHCGPQPSRSFRLRHAPWGGEVQDVSTFQRASFRVDHSRSNHSVLAQRQPALRLSLPSILHSRRPHTARTAYAKTPNPGCAQPQSSPEGRGFILLPDLPRPCARFV
jgi:hypothetical protein